MTKELLKGKEITIGREQLREMGFPVSDEKYEPQPGIYRVDGGSVTVVLTDVSSGDPIVDVNSYNFPDDLKTE